VHGVVEDGVAGIRADAHGDNRDKEGHVRGVLVGNSNVAEDTEVVATEAANVGSSSRGEELNLTEEADSRGSRDVGADGLAHVAENNVGNATSASDLGQNGSGEGTVGRGHGSRRVVANDVAGRRYELIRIGRRGGAHNGGVEKGSLGLNLADETGNR